MQRHETLRNAPALGRITMTHHVILAHYRPFYPNARFLSTGFGNILQLFLAGILRAL
jgi:hypothetical protein